MNAQRPQATPPLQWWGYRHQSGTVHLKRYFDERDIDEAYESPFCKTIVRPFVAASHELATEKLKEALAKAEGNAAV